MQAGSSAPGDYSALLEIAFYFGKSTIFARFSRRACRRSGRFASGLDEVAAVAVALCVSIAQILDSPSSIFF
jgi:hypothetical protein